MNRTINFRLLNNILGWVVFGLALSIYLLTLEPSGSFWDCGEFAACATKLEIPHAPGAPLFTLLYRIAAILNPSNPTVMCNGASALVSAFTILFLFWTISWFGCKIFVKTFEQRNIQKIIILAASFIGSMSYAVSDSFWFSAVETEVYALSSLFTAVVFWCIIKWEENDGKNENSERWLLLTAYLLGLSIGVHLLNLLAIPAIVLVYFLKKRPFGAITILKALGVSCIILVCILVVLIPGIPWYFAKLELLVVNVFGLPYNSGMLTALFLLAVLLIAGWLYSLRKNKIILSRIITYFTIVFIGFSTYAFILLRSHDNPPVDMNNPEDPFSLAYYLSREQYGKRPLLFGQSFESPVASTEERFTYMRYEGKYIKMPLNPKVNYNKESLMFFPRLSSDVPGHPEAYKFWTGGFHGKKIPNPSGAGYVTLPSFGDNLKFFIRYQLGFMYFRYFLWNFSGRQNDILGHGNVLHGNWISGIPVIDNSRLGLQENLPSCIADNRAHNCYFMLPMLLGLIGLYFQFRSDKSNFLVVTLFFLFTGVAIVVYLNEVPVIPRERDYVNVGSFYVFSIWMGMGVLGLFALLRKFLRKMEIAAVVVAVAAAIVVPVIMLQQNWDDHNRSSRYTLLEYARNYLESCEPNAILFTNADNDTYPLWYAQEVAGIRRDVRIVLLPYLSAEWYVDQLRMPTNQSVGIKMSLTRDKFVGGKRSYLPVYERTDTAVDLKELLEFVGSDDLRAKLDMQNGEKMNYIPARKLLLKDKAVASNTNSVEISVKTNYLRMDQLVLFDIMQSNFGNRPLYFTTPQETLNYGLHNYLQLDGVAYKLTNTKKEAADYDEVGSVESHTLYNKLMVQLRFTSLENGNIYFDNTHVAVFSMLSLRNKFVKLAEQLFLEGDSIKASKVLDKIVKIIPDHKISYDRSMAKIAELYLNLGENEKGKTILKEMTNYCKENLQYFCGLPNKHLGGIRPEIQINLYLLQEIYNVAQKIRWDELIKECEDLWSKEGAKLMAVLK
jgi:hypothetical protein